MSWNIQLDKKNFSQLLEVFHNIIYGCELTICSDHMNFTRSNTKHANLRVLWQHIELDYVYGAKIEHIARIENTGADRLSRLDVRSVLQKLVNEVFAIDKLDRDENEDFSLSLSLIKSEQNKWDKLQNLSNNNTRNLKFGTLHFGDHEVITIDGLIAVPPSLQQHVVA